MRYRSLVLAAAISASPLALITPAKAQIARVVVGCSGASFGSGDNVVLNVDETGKLCTSGASGSGSSPSTPTYTASAGITRTRIACTLPAYTTGGNVVCTDSAGQQTTTACAANTACLVSAANASRKTATFQIKTAGVTVDIGYAATIAPGLGIGLDGPAVAGGGSATSSEIPAHVGAYYAASPAASTIVMVQGQ